MMSPYLYNLELDKVFALYAANPDIYIEESDKNEHIVDSESLKISGFVSYSFGSKEELLRKYFDVENPKGCCYSLLKIDNGLIRTTATRKCDCAIANDKEICFIEFKANATSNKPDTIAGNYKKAMKQLSTTIGIFNRHYATKGITIKALRNVEAYVCFRAGYPRCTSSQMGYKVKFAEQNDGIALLFKRKKTL